MSLTENEYRIIGPPGCGKTTYLSSQVSRAIEAGRSPLITSLTKAAAMEIGSRCEFDWDFSESQVGTLHAHCYRALGRPDLISTEDHVADWNEYSSDIDPTWRLSLTPFGTQRSKDGEHHHACMGDATYTASLIHRARRDPDERIPISVRRFRDKFNEWRSLNKLFDFTSLVEQCFADRVAAPENPDVIFVDEAQDHDRLELSLVRQWAADADQLIVCGDPDQNLYEFRGATPDAFYSHDLPDGHTIPLEQSYRVPERIHREAVQMIDRIDGRVDVPYKPTDERGRVYKSQLSLREAHLIVSRCEQLTDKGETVMILATCEYMLAGIIKQLRLAGLTFHNPFAPNRGSFNPLGDRRGVSTPRRLMSLLRTQRSVYGGAASLWTWTELHQWIEPISVKGFLKRGAKKKIAEIVAERGGQIVDRETLGPLLDPETGSAELRKIDADPIQWFRPRLLTSKMKSFEYPIEVIQRRGAAELERRPNIIIGTIHSVKGGEADHVLLFPDLSPQGFETMNRNEASIIRQFYVGMTRARQTLSLARPSGNSFIRW